MSASNSSSEALAASATIVDIEDAEGKVMAIQALQHTLDNKITYVFSRADFVATFPHFEGLSSAPVEMAVPLLWSAVRNLIKRVNDLDEKLRQQRSCEECITSCPITQ